MIQTVHNFVVFDPVVAASNVDRSAVQKTVELTDARSLTLLAQDLLDFDALSVWQNTTLGIHQCIYELDFFYELNGSLGGSAEEVFWKNLDNVGIGLPSDLQDCFQLGVHDLKNYAQVEGRLRLPEKIYFRELSEISFLKCVDVRISREIVLNLSSLESNLPRSFFRTFDAFMEVVEDLCDLQEDRFDWNFNFWLTPVRQGHAVYDSVHENLSLITDLSRRAEETWSFLSPIEKWHLACYRTKLHRIFQFLSTNKRDVCEHIQAQSWTPYV